MLVRLEEDELGNLSLPLSEECLAEAGWKVGDLLEIAPMKRVWIKGEQAEHVENIVHIRPVRM